MKELKLLSFSSSLIGTSDLQVLAVAPSNGFAKVHYGFILKSENKIAESIPYLKVKE